jgi:3-phenylpropionate/trans-cinnamate dioxygenase ferredoxin reductase component
VADYRYLIVGGGMTGDAACRGIRDHDPDGSIGIVGEEPDPPYSRPPLSKALWQGKDETSIWRGTADLGVELDLGRAVVALDRSSHTVTDGTGGTHGYERLLLATGGLPRRLPGDTGSDVVYFRRLPDYRRLRALADAHAEFVVLGGGFIGSELAAALNQAGCSVRIVFPEQGIGARLFPGDMAGSINELYTGHGVEVLPGERVSSVDRDGERFSVRLESGSVLEADAVVAGLGIVPRTELAEAAGLEVDDGIVVDEYGRAGGSGDVYAAGDVARFPSEVLGTDMRVEHEDHANSHGRTVGANMAGADEAYRHQPFFYSDLFELGYEAVGEVDSRKETVAEWGDPFRKGVVAYLDEAGRPRGFLLVDTWGKVEAATELIAAAEPLGPGTLASLAG